MERGRGEVYGTNGETSVSGPEKVDRLRGPPTKPDRDDLPRGQVVSWEFGVLPLVGQICTRWIQRVTPDPYLPHHFKFYSVCSTV